MEEKLQICRVLDYDKLSASSLIILSHDMNFPACATVTASACQHSKHRILPRKTGHLEIFYESKSCHSTAKEITEDIEDEDKIVYMKKLDYQIKDSRFKTCVPLAANLKKSSSICPTNSRTLSGFYPQQKVTSSKVCP